MYTKLYEKQERKLLAPCSLYLKYKYLILISAA